MGTASLVWECVVFAGFVCITTCAPLWRRRGDKGDKNGGTSAKLAYVFAGGGISTIAMILSISRGTLGVRSFLGYPSELVYRGASMWETLYGMCLAMPLVGWLLLPLFWRTSTTSVYEYLQLRFNNSWIRRAAAATFVIRQLLNLAVTVYTPSVALHAVLALPHWASAAALTAVTAVFTLLGGLAAAIRADVIQTVTMVVVSCIFIVQATIKAGGPAAVLQTNIDGGRLQFFNFTGDPRTRVDTSSAIVGQLFMSLSIYGCQQTFVQRYCSLPSLQAARRTLYSAVPAIALLFSMSWIVGMALYALYEHCDPLMSGKIAAPDEVLPFYVQDQLTFLPGMLGLFLGSLFNGALSFLVSNVNSLATVTWEDFVSAAPAFKGINDNQQLTVIKIIGILYAILIMFLSLGVGLVDGVVGASQLVTSATSGALLGVFVLAAACPLANGKGAFMGMIAAHVVTTALAVGRFLKADLKEPLLHMDVDSCPNNTISTLTSRPLIVNQTLLQLSELLRNTLPRVTVPESSFATSMQYVFSISYMWYAVIGTLVCVLVGNIVGIATGTADDRFDEQLLHPYAAKIASHLPSIGVPRTFKEKEKKEPKIEDNISVIVVTPEICDTAKTAVSDIADCNVEVMTSSGSRLFDAYEPCSRSERTKF